jgi:hypothetical protein
MVGRGRDLPVSSFLDSIDQVGDGRWLFIGADACR